VARVCVSKAEGFRDHTQDCAAGVPAQAFSVSGFILLRSHDSHGRALDCVVSERVNEKPCLESSVPQNQQSPWTAKAQANRR